MGILFYTLCFHALSHHILSIPNILEEIVSCVDPSLCFLDDKVTKKKSVGHLGQFLSKIYNPMYGKKAEVKKDHAYACWDDLSQPRQKAEALIPIIVLAFAGFNSSTSRFKFVVQDMVGRMFF
jgi:hypothetical protein